MIIGRHSAKKRNLMITFDGPIGCLKTTMMKKVAKCESGILSMEGKG